MPTWFSAGGRGWQKINQKHWYLNTKIRNFEIFLTTLPASSYKNHESKIEDFFRIKSAATSNYRGSVLEFTLDVSSLAFLSGALCQKASFGNKAKQGKVLNLDHLYFDIVSTARCPVEDLDLRISDFASLGIFTFVEMPLQINPFYAKQTQSPKKSNERKSI